MSKDLSSMTQELRALVKQRHRPQQQTTGYPQPQQQSQKPHNAGLTTPSTIIPSDSTRENNALKRSISAVEGSERDMPPAKRRDTRKAPPITSTVQDGTFDKTSGANVQVQNNLGPSTVVGTQIFVRSLPIAEQFSPSPTGRSLSEVLAEEVEATPTDLVMRLSKLLKKYGKEPFQIYFFEETPFTAKQIARISQTDIKQTPQRDDLSRWMLTQNRRHVPSANLERFFAHVERKYKDLKQILKLCDNETPKSCAAFTTRLFSDYQPIDLYCLSQLTPNKIFPCLKSEGDDLPVDEKVTNDLISAIRARFAMCLYPGSTLLNAIQLGDKKREFELMGPDFMKHMLGLSNFDEAMSVFEARVRALAENGEEEDPNVFDSGSGVWTRQDYITLPFDDTEEL